MITDGEEKMAQGTPGKPPGNGGQNGNNAQNNANARNAAPNANAMNHPIAMLKADHRKVEQLFATFEKAQNSGEQSQLAAEICKELMIHSLLEEEIFYAECRDKMEDRPLDEAQVEHDGIKPLLMEIMEGSPEDQLFMA